MKRDCEIIEAHFFEVPPSKVFATRPITSSCRESNLDVMIRRYRDDTDNGRLNSATTVASIANSLFEPSGSPEREVELPGGTRRSRMVVMLVVKEYGTHSVDKIQYIAGFSDIYQLDELSDADGNIGDRVQFYFNSVIVARTSRSGESRRQSTKVQSSSQIVGQPDGRNYRDLRRDDRPRQRMRNGESQEFLLSPRSVANVMSEEAIRKSIGGSSRSSEHRNDLDGTKRINYADRLSSSYLGRILDGYGQASRNRRYSNEDQFARRDINFASEFMTKLKDKTAVELSFFQEIMTDSEFDIQGYIEYGDLRRIFPEIEDDRVGRVHLIDRDDEFDPDFGEGWVNSRQETIIANQIVSSLPPLMIDLMITEASFIITNEESDDGGIEMYYNRDTGAVKSLFSGTLKTEAMDVLRDRVLCQVMPGMGFTNADFFINATVSLTRESQVNVAFDGGSIREYPFPSFADAMASPLVTVDPELIEEIASDIGRFTGAIDEFLGDDTDIESDTDDINDSISRHLGGEPTHRKIRSI